MLFGHAACILVVRGFLPASLVPRSPTPPQAQDRLTLQERDSSASHTALSDRVAELTAQLSSTDSRAAASEAAGVQLEQELQAAQQQVTERDTQLAQLQEQLSAKSAEWSEVLQRLAATEADLTEQAAGRAAAEAEVASLTQRLEATDSSLAATQESSLHQAEALAKAQQELADLQQQLEARGSELADVSSQAEELRDELQQLRVRERELEGSTQHHQAEGVRLGELVANLEAQLGAARGDHGASEQRVRQLTEELSAAKAKCEELEEAKAQLEATTARQVSNKQVRHMGGRNSALLRAWTVCVLAGRRVVCAFVKPHVILS